MLAEFSPVPGRQRSEPGLVAKVTKLLGAVANPQGEEELAAVGTRRLGKSTGVVGRKEESAFHRPTPLFNMLNNHSKTRTSQ